MRPILTAAVLFARIAVGQAAADADTLPPLLSIDSPAPLLDAGAQGAGVAPEDRMTFTAQALARLRDSVQVVAGKLEEARSTRDVVKLNCVNEKLTQLKALLRVSEQSEGLLRDATSSKDESAAEHEISKVTIAGQKADQLRTEADECIGQLAFRTDDSLTVEVITPPGLADDPTRAPPPENVVVRPPRPPPASPVL